MGCPMGMNWPFGLSAENVNLGAGHSFVMEILGRARREFLENKPRDAWGLLRPTERPAIHATS